MSAAAIFLLVAATIAMAVDWCAVGRGRVDIERLAKPSVMLFLIGTALVADIEPASLRPWIVAALAFGLAGDVFLLPEVDRFLFGLAAFLVGHASYVIAFSTIWSPSGLVIVGAAGFAALISMFGVPIERAVRRSRMRIPVAAYIAISGAVIVAASGSGRWLALAGALSFAASDGFIGHARFVSGARQRRVLVHATYHLGQAAIVISTTMT